MIKEWLLRLPRRYKRIMQVGVDVLLIWLSLWLAFVVRLGWDDAIISLKANYWMLWVAPLLTIPAFIPLGMYRAVIRYFGLTAILTVCKAVTIASLLFALAIYWNHTDHSASIPRSYIVIYWFITLFAMGGSRVFIRYYLNGVLSPSNLKFLSSKSKNNYTPVVAIYGAGAAGNQLLYALKSSKNMQLAAFIDDDKSLHGRTIAGLRVYDSNRIQYLIKDLGVEQVLLAIPSASRARRREVLSHLESFSLHVRSVPGYLDLASGRIQVQDIQEVDVADLLGRDVVEPNKELFDHCIKNKVVMVTGAGGSIGSELCRQILASGATALVLYEHSEFNLYNIHMELEERVLQEALNVQVVPILGSIRNRKRLMEVMLTWKVATVYHAAAYKHVPMVEHNTAEGILNNVMGTLNTAQAAITCGVQNFVLISTDKAVRPTNVMGGTKRLAEMVLQALSAERYITLFNSSDDASYENTTRFTMVRFGNVLGSSGSVIPLFREQIKNGGPVTVTHPNITRFFMTIPEAAQLVIQAGSMGQGGDVFVLDMGEPVKIADLAEKMILLTGLTIRSESAPAGDIEIQYTGLRPGEKLYEELLIGAEVQKTEHPKIMRANEIMLPWGQLESVLKNLDELVMNGDCESIRKVLREVVDGYTPQGEIVDLVYNMKKMSVL